jgi:hypothetical protein
MKIVLSNSASPVFAATAVLSLLILIAGCNTGKSAPTNYSFIRGLNNYFLEHPDCLLANVRFPLETTDRDQIKQMDSLVKSLLLNKTIDAGVHTARYTPSTFGTRYAPHFCYGHRVVISIDSSSPLAVANGFKTTSVTYHYKMEDTPVWAKTSDVLAAFPAMALATSGQATGKSNLAQTTAGWQVPD